MVTEGLFFVNWPQYGLWSLVQQQCVAVALRSLKFSTKVIGGKQPDLLVDQAVQVVDELLVAVWCE